MSTSTLEMVQQTMAAQAATAPRAADIQPWLTRFVFVPFFTRRLTTHRRVQYGLPNGLRQGIIERIKRFERSIIDDDAVNRVPTDRWGNFVRTSLGVHETRPYEGQPAALVNAILRSHNPEYVGGGEGDNGIIEVVSLRGVDDDATYGRVQATLLPVVPTTAREQIAQLERVDLSRFEPVFDQTRQELLHSTQVAMVWGKIKYAQLQNKIEEFGRTGRTGKSELTRFDRALCRWMELAEPKLQSMLAGGGQMSQSIAPALPNFVVCEDCGNMINLLPDGRMPRRGCIACGWNPNGAGSSIAPVVADSASQAEFEEVTGGSRRTLEEKQAEMRRKNGKE